MSDPTRRNRLDEAASPYLRQHADNPVNWQPWDEAALAGARERDVPIFLSIGYSACHWCHVMEEESFEDPEVAAFLNEHFVPVKVDREERPDLDAVYMTVSQLVTGRGGWPLSAWLTPEGDPFYVGTYFPREPRQGQPGFLDVLRDVHESWETERRDVEERAGQWAAAARGELESVPDQPGTYADDVLRETAEDALRSADREHGGFGRAPKFPQPRRTTLLLQAAERTGRAGFREVATQALDAMAAGGLHDHVGGGFHRYATDRDWTVPHFEKMAYDNAELPRAYLAGAQAAGDDRYAEVAADTLAFVERELQHPEGGFYSTLDARSVDPESGESEEGAFYVWTPEQVRAAMRSAADRGGGDASEDADDPDADGADAGRGDGVTDPDPDLLADLFCARFGVDEAGNFEGETVLTLSATAADLAAEFDRDPETVAALLGAARQRAFEARAERPRPRRDEKVLAGWNGLLIAAFAEAGLVLEERYADVAGEALAFVREHLWDAEEARLARRYKDGDVAGEGYLEDYAFLADAALRLYGVTAEVDHLAFALELARVVEAEFWDEETGTLYFTPAGGEDLLARPQELTDQSTPASAGVAAQVLARLSHFVPHERFRDVAAGVVETHADRLSANPLQHVSLVGAADELQTGPLEVTVVADGVPESFRAALAERYLPDRLLAPRPADDAELDRWLDVLGLEAAPPVWADREQVDGEPTVYVCRRACSPPETDVAAALDWAAEHLAPE